MTTEPSRNDSQDSATGYHSGLERTSATLLLSLKSQDADGTAWERFVERYEPLIQGWCRSWGLQDSDSRDISQDVLLRLSKTMEKFEYDSGRNFRAWLKTVTHHAWVDWVKQQPKLIKKQGDTSSFEVLQTVEAGDDLSSRLEAEYDAELMEQAIERVRMRVKLRTWQAFQMTAMEGRSGAEVAAKLDMQVAHVYVAKSEVLKALHDEVKKLDPS